MIRHAAFAIAATLAAASPAQAFSGGIASDVAARAKAQRFLEARLGAGAHGAAIDLVDLDADGVPEALATAPAGAGCANGCGFILRLSSNQATELGGYAARSLVALATRTGGWRDVAVDSRKVTFQSGRYVR